MGIILKYTLKSIAEKKFRTFLIVVSIALSVALAYSSLGLKDSIIQTFTEMIKTYLGTANVMVTPNEDSPGPYVRVKPLGEAADLFEYQIGTLQLSGSYDKGPNTPEGSLQIRGYTTEDLALLDVLDLSESLDGEFSGNWIYLSRELADENGWKLGDTIDLKIDGVRRKVQIAGIGPSKGALATQSGTAYGVMPTSTLQKFAGTGDRVHFILAKTADGVPVAEAMAALERSYDRYAVEEPIPWDEISTSLNSIIIPFLFMLVLVLAMAVFIIFTAFKVITTEKLPVLGTFRSIGATKRTTDAILLAESIGYGVLGSALGLLLGRFILNFMGGMMATSMMGMSAPEKAPLCPQYMVAAGVSGVLLAFFSALVPIIRVSRLPVRAIVLGEAQPSGENRFWKLMLGLLMIGLSIALPQFQFGSAGVLACGVAVVLLCAALVLLTPYVTAVATAILERTVKFPFGNLGVLAVKNMRGNRSILDNISLLTLGISGILLISIISTTVSEQVLDFYNRAEFQVYVNLYGADRQDVQRVRQIEGVTDVCAVYAAGGVKVSGTDVVISEISGAEGLSYLDIWGIDLDEGTSAEDVLRVFGEGRAIVLSTSLRDRIDVEAGDWIRLTFANEKTHSYQVAGFLDTLMNNGSFAIANPDWLKRDGELPGYSNLMVKSLDPDGTKTAIEERFRERGPYVATMQQMKDENMQANAMIFLLLQGFSAIAMLIGIFGILNNFVVSLLARRRSLAVMRSVGLSRSQTRRLLSMEAFFSGVIGGGMGVAGSLLLTYEIGFMLKLINLPVELNASPETLIPGFLAGMVLSIVANFLPAVRASKMSIVASIKYE